MRSVFPIIILFAFLSCARTIDYSQLEPADAYRPLLPVLIQPVTDVSNGNVIESVFVKGNTNTGALIMEITVVFTDEDMPVSLGDFMGDLNRRMKYKRMHALKTFYFEYESDEGKKPVEVILSNTFSSEQSFDDGTLYSAELPEWRFTFIGYRPVIYVNTWNHLLSYRDYNSKAAKVTNSEYPIYRGNRETVEGLFR